MIARYYDHGIEPLPVPGGRGTGRSGRRSKVRLRVVACFIFLLIVSSSGAEERPQVGGFFSNIRYTSGDVIGTAVWIVRSEQDFWATVQIAEGHIAAPVTAFVEVSGTKVRFTIPYELYDQGGKPLPPKMILFEGTVTAAALKLTSGEILKRRNSWQ
jgi:hypothetical protein